MSQSDRDDHDDHREHNHWQPPAVAMPMPATADREQLVTLRRHILMMDPERPPVIARIVRRRPSGRPGFSM